MILFKSKKIIIFVFFILMGAILLSNSNYVGLSKDKNTKDSSNLVDNHKNLIEKLKTTKKIEIYHDYHSNDIKPIYVTDKNIINDYLSLIQKNSKENNKSISNASVKDQKLVFYTDDEKIEIKYSYDDLYNFGFINYEGKKIYINYDFFRLISNTQRYYPKKSNVDKETRIFFKKYNWTPSFLIASHNVKISDNFKYAPEKGIDEIYWAYNLEFSKSIGLDFSNLKGKNVTAQVYYLLEEFPKSESPITSTNAILLKYNGKIVGAYIDSGILNRAICSLNSKSFEEITGLNISDYIIKNSIDKSSKLNNEISNLTSEDLIKLHYKSQEDKDIYKYLSTLSIEAIISLLEPDQFDIKKEIFNDLDRNDTIFKNANEVEILEVSENNSKDIIKEVNIKLNILKSNQITMNEGIYNMTVTMRKDINGIYKIVSIGF